MLITAGVVIVVIFLFLGSLRATLIPAITLPLSIIATFAGMALFGFSLNNISLLALTLALGFVVDDAIVVLENIVRHIERGMSPFQAAIVGSREIGFTVLSITVSLVAVFIPVLFMAGIVGRFFFEFAVTIQLAILVSGFIALTLTPMMCARLLKGHDAGHRPAASAAPSKIPRGLTRVYAVTLDWSLRLRWLMLLLTIGTIAATVWGFGAGQEGLPADRRYRTDVRSHRGGRRHLVRGHGRAAAAGRRALSPTTPTSSRSIPAFPPAAFPRRSATATCSSN